MDSETADDLLTGDYHGARSPLFWLAVRVTILTALTLGLYRFWAKTRIRKYIWSSVSAGGDSFEYTGTGFEKFLGFLAAIVILAIYLGLLQILLFFFGLSLFDASQAPGQVFLQFGALALPTLAILPLIFFAQYRARRYKLARTRWRGVRFGAEAAAWGYVWRAMGHWALTLLSLGLLLPRQTFWLEKYVTDRSWYGDAKFTQYGSWRGMYGAMRHLLIGVALILGAGMAALLNAPAAAIGAILLGLVWFMIGLVSYRVRSFQYLTSYKVLGGDIRFAATPGTGFIIRKVIVGSIVISLLSAVILGIPAAAMGVIVGLEMVPIGLAIIPGVVLYMVGLAMVASLSLVWILQPIIAHVVESVVVGNAGALDRIRQRAGDTGADAEGFADALDIGGAI